jgi:hypothetical protein
MSATYTSAASVQELDFESLCPLIRCGCLECGFCSSNQRFACGFLRIPPHDGHPCRPASSSPDRACRGLPISGSPPRCAPCRAHQKKSRERLESFAASLTPLSSSFREMGAYRPERTRPSTICTPNHSGTLIHYASSRLTGRPIIFITKTLSHATAIGNKQPAVAALRLRAMLWVPACIQISTLPKTSPARNPGKYYISIRKSNTY